MFYIKKVKKLLYLEVLKTIYDMIQLALLSYITMTKYLETDSLKFNPYETCVSNKILEEGSLTVVFRVDDIKASNVDKTVVDKF